MDDFDARAARQLQPGDHLILPDHPGLRMVATTTKRSWIYRYKSPVDGGMRQVKIGEWPKVSSAAAEDVWKKLREQREAGADPQLQKKTARRQALAARASEPKRAYTIADLVDHYLAEHIDARRKPKGRAEVRRLLTTHTAPIAAKPAAEVLRSQVFELLQGLSDRPVLMAQVRQEMGAAHSHALDAGRLPENTANWWREVLRGKMPRSKGKTINGEYTGGTKRVLNERELGVLINFLPNLSLLLRDTLTMYLWTGTRGAEIVTMQFGEVEEEDGVWWWTIPKAKTKNARHATAQDLRVPLLGRARALVLRRRKEVEDKPETMGYLFPSKGGRTPNVEQKTIQSSLYAYQPYAAEFREKQGRAGLPILPVSHWSPHDLRRSVRTLLAAMGCPDAVAEAVLGHMPSGIVGVYNRHQYDAERLDWLTRLDAKLEQLAAQHAAS